MMTETARRYGGSLYELALEEGMVDEVLAQLREVLDLMKENPQYERLLAEPSITKKERTQLIDEAFGSSLWPYLLNFLKLLCEEGYIPELKGCYKEDRRRYNEDHGISEATVTSARELTETQKAALLDKLEKMSGKKVEMICLVNPALIGGVRLDFEGKRYDGTAAERLKTLRSIIRNTTV